MRYNIQNHLNKIVSKKKSITEIQLDRFTPLKNSNRIAVCSSSKLPVTVWTIAPRKGAVSNLHWYKLYGITPTIKKNETKTI
jgi:hypothetical protein